MSSGEFKLDFLQKTTYEIAANYPRSKLFGGEVILGIRASIGAAFVVPEFLKGVNLSRGVARIDCNEKIRNFFLVSFLKSDQTETYWQLSKQGSTFNEVSIETVKELKIPCPPLPEQQAIVTFLDAETSRMDTLIAEAQKGIGLLKERRSALISAAVTGQIDVREWQVPEAVA